MQTMPVILSKSFPHVEGKWEPETIVLHPAQCFFICQLFGFRNKTTGKRRFTSPYLQHRENQEKVPSQLQFYCIVNAVKMSLAHR